MFIPSSLGEMTASSSTSSCASSFTVRCLIRGTADVMSIPRAAAEVSAAPGQRVHRHRPSGQRQSKAVKGGQRQSKVGAPINRSDCG
eukprot:1179460-Prorocentrum_minimum.AAC.3